jgi:hypothetical protein
MLNHPYRSSNKLSNEIPINNYEIIFCVFYFLKCIFTVILQLGVVTFIIWNFTSSIYLFKIALGVQFISIIYGIFESVNNPSW